MEAELERQPLVEVPPVAGTSDCGGSFGSLPELWALQERERERLYECVAAYWDQGGYGGDTDAACMIGDATSNADLAASLAWLDSVLARRGTCQRRHRALDAGAGVGRVAKGALLKRFEHVTLMEPCDAWRDKSHAFLGKKGEKRCAFVAGRLEAPPADLLGDPFDVVWVQWALQYLTDADVVASLRRLGALLAPGGALLVTENRPMPPVPAEEFHVNLPHGPCRRYHVVRSDAQHRLLFALAGLVVASATPGDETTRWELRVAGDDDGAPPVTR